LFACGNSSFVRRDNNINLFFGDERFIKIKRDDIFKSEIIVECAAVAMNNQYFIERKLFKAIADNFGSLGDQWQWMVLACVTKISKNKMLPYFAGRFDGDGNADAKMSTEKKIIRLRILQPRSFSAKVLPYVVHKNKRQQLKLIIRKRSYGS